jgi:uncharacterized membrane protein YfcA
MNSNSDIERLASLSGTFFSDRSTKIWRGIFIIFGWIALPILFVGALIQKESIESIIVSFFLALFGCIIGYMFWLQKAHRYEITNGIVRSIGRKVLWSVPLSDVQRISEYKSGRFVIWWLHTAKRQRGIVLYESLRSALSGHTQA